MTTTSTTPSTVSSTSTPLAESEREIKFEDLVSGCLTLQVLRNQLDTQIAGLRAQLMVAEEQLRRTEDMLRRAEEKLARQHPDKVSPRPHEVEPEHRRSPSSASSPVRRSGGSKRRS